MTFPDVPSEIAAAASEAYRGRMVANANRAAILLARSVIEATAKDKGITKGNAARSLHPPLEPFRQSSCLLALRNDAPETVSV